MILLLITSLILAFIVFFILKKIYFYEKVNFDDNNLSEKYPSIHPAFAKKASADTRGERAHGECFSSISPIRNILAKARYARKMYRTMQRSKYRINSINILLTCTEEYFIGGAEIHIINLYQRLKNNGFNANLLVAKNSKLEKALIDLKLNYYAYAKFRFLKNVFQPAFKYAINQIVKKEKIQIIHTQLERENKAAIKIAKLFNIKVITTRHVVYKLKKRYTAGLDGMIGVSPQITKYLKKENLEQNYNIKKIDFIAPFFDYERFLNFKPNSISRYNFFYHNFGLKIKANIPIICMIGVVTENKNQKLLLKALNSIIYEKNKQAQLIFVGAGCFDKLKELSKELGIAEFTYFINFNNKIPDILHHSDIKILPSIQEAFSISILEAAVCKKPIICATKTGSAETVIIDGQTGLLFENNNLESLINKIELLLNNKELQKELGENAYNHVLQNFVGEQIFAKQIKFYEKIQY